MSDLGGGEKGRANRAIRGLRSSSLPLRLSRLVGPSCRHIGQYRDESSSISSLVNFNSFTLLILLTPMLIDGALNDGDLCCCRVTKASTTTRNCEESEEETAPGQNLA
jgi:hypothetical protein